MGSSVSPRRRSKPTGSGGGFVFPETIRQRGRLTPSSRTASLSCAIRSTCTPMTCERPKAISELETKPQPYDELVGLVQRLVRAPLLPGPDAADGKCRRFVVHRRGADVP